MAKVKALVGFAHPDGFVYEGEEFDAGDAVVKGREGLFAKVDETKVEKPAARKTAAAPKSKAE
jgi:hypothetical protein